MHSCITNYGLYVVDREAQNDGYGARRAINELLAIFSCQWRNGMLPQIRFVPGQRGYRPDADDWGVPSDVSGPTALRTSGITQPPIIGLCAYEVFLKFNEGQRIAHLGDFLAIVDGLDRYHDWLFRERDPWGEHLVLCLHPWETGTDNSPAFDPLVESTRTFIEAAGVSVETFGRADTVHVRQEHRPTDRDYFAYFGLVALFKKHNYDQHAIIEQSPFLLQDVLFNSLLAVSLRALASLQEALADIADGPRPTKLRERAALNIEKASAVSGAIRDKLWHEGDGFFYAYDRRAGQPLTTPTVSGFVPLMDNIASAEQAARLIARLSDRAEFWTPVPLPSTSPRSASFNPLRYWSGPSWPVTNWLVMRGLMRHAPQLAEQLRLSTINMICEGVGQEPARRSAVQVMERNSVGEQFTTPSTRQYQHAWLWDSAIVAVSWPLVHTKSSLSSLSPSPADAPPDADHPDKPGFWEYYHPYTGEPLGARPMTWTASLLLELLANPPHPG
jgi:hypothetical protein